MKSIFLKLIACVVLMGAINATLIEPALCFMHEDAVSQQEENGQCCSACHPAHHQGMMASDICPHFTANHSIDFVSLPQFSLSDSPSRSIFHPPLAS